MPRTFPDIAARGDLSERRIELQVEVPIPRARAFELWSSSQGMGSWWTSNNRIELIPNGAYELYFLMDNPPGLRGGEGCRVLGFLPDRMLSFTWNAPPHLDTRSQHTWVVLEFSDIEGGTRVSLTHLGWPERAWHQKDSHWPDTYAYFEAAWKRVMGMFAEAR